MAKDLQKNKAKTKDFGLDQGQIGEITTSHLPTSGGMLSVVVSY